VLFLVFRIGRDRYALEASQVTEVLPLVEIRPVPHAPAGVAGLFDLRGVPVPVIDLSAIVAGRPAERRLSTRVVLVRYPDVAGEFRPLGLIAEKITTTAKRDATDFLDSGITHDRAWYLGPVASDAEGLLQWIDVTQLLPSEVRAVLFRTAETNRCLSSTSKAS
jgi:chemotaxis-related protein WspB